MLTSRSLFLATLSFALGAPPAAAVGFSAPAEGTVLVAEERIEVRWQPLPAGVEEAELLLSCDGGLHFARVADLRSTARAGSWTVPNLPTRSAVLALRARLDGREILLFRTGPLSISPVPGREPAPVSFHGGELWTDAAGSATPVSETGLDSSRPEARTSSPDESDLDEDDPAFHAPSAETRVESPLALAALPPSPRSLHRSSAPLVVPKRE
jgi:hypothetical protein